MTRVYSAAEVHAALPWNALAEALADAFATGADVPVRHAHALGGDDALLLMPAWNRRMLGTKIVTVMPGNAARGVGTVQAAYLLMDRVTGEPLALLDGEALTLRRTAAASALAARWMARAGASRLLVVGSGRLAEWMARAHSALRPGLVQVEVWGRNPEAAQALARQLRSAGDLAGARVDAVDDLPRAVGRADIVCCATTATEPVVHGDWLRPGQHLDLVGAFKPSMREADDAAVAAARIVVDTRAGALKEAGDLVQALAAGVIGPSSVVGELADLATGRVAGRTDDSQITLFKSVGTALEDLAAAELVLQRTA
jgi:ornithine cyclodeaminase